MSVGPAFMSVGPAFMAGRKIFSLRLRFNCGPPLWSAKKKNRPTIKVGPTEIEIG
jgi:hypothetical protein